MSTGSKSLRIVVAGMAAQFPLGGVAWDYLQYVVGLARLGHDVYYYEDTGTWPYDPVRRQFIEEGDYSAGYLDKFFRQYAPELSGRWHYWHLKKKAFGMPGSKISEILRTADLFLNISGACYLPENLSPRCVKVFLDTDPGYNQILYSERFAWSDHVEEWCSLVAAHDRHFTYAENINDPGCAVPTVGFQWKTTRMPVVLDLWKPLARTRPAQTAPWSTIMTWSAFKGKLLYQGKEYQSKGHEFEKLMDLPSRVRSEFKVGMGGSAPVDKLKRYGWKIVDGASVTMTPQSYQKFIEDSKAELSAAKQVYVAMESGWFSCRSACYLAAARPVVVQDTGFSRIFLENEGILAFKTKEEALRAVEFVEADYDRHSAAALRCAKEYFESGKVLTRFIGDILNGN